MHTQVLEVSELKLQNAEYKESVHKEVVLILRRYHQKKN
jgi:hypothetical protein